MFFLNPTYLWALLGLSIPIAIHFWSKKEGKTIKIGSIKLLSKADSKQSHSIKLNELWLLLLRMLIFTLLVIIMAAPQIPWKTTKSSVTYIIEPSLLSNYEVLSIIDTLDSDIDIRLLKNGFPEYKSDSYIDSFYQTPMYWQLAKEMESLKTDSIVVFTNAYLSGIYGIRPHIHKKIAWIVLDQGTSVATVLETRLKNDQLQLQMISSNYQSLEFEKVRLPLNSTQIEFNVSNDSIRLVLGEKQQWGMVKTVETIKVLLFYDEDFTDEVTYLEASFNAISKHLDRPIEINKTKDITNLNLSSYYCIVWLSEKTVEQIPTKLLVYNPDTITNSLVEAGPANNIFYLSARLNTENIVEEHLPEQLISMLNLNNGLEQKIRKYDQRIMNKASIQTKYSSLKSVKENPSLLSVIPSLWMLLALLLAAERIFANYRKQ